MELVGDEKRLQALFHELRLDDAQLTTPFAVSWARVVSITDQPRRMFNPRLAVAVMLLASALVALGIWFRGGKTAAPANMKVTNQSATPYEKKVDELEEITQVVSNNPRRAVPAIARRRAARRARPTAIQQLTALSAWKSPTGALLSSPSSEILSSLPQLDEYTNEMKSFLRTEPK